MENPTHVRYHKNKHLSEEEFTALLTLLTKYEFLFDKTLCTCKTKYVGKELQTDSKTHPVPRAHEAVFEK